jgi:hypothetical protein
MNFLRSLLGQGTLTEEDGWLSTIDLFIKIGYLVKKNKNVVLIRKAADLNWLVQGGQPY